MATTPRSQAITTAAAEKPAVVGVEAIVVLMAGMFAAWFAAGSTGLLAHPLRIALTWGALTVAIVAGRPRRGQSGGAWIALVVGVILGLIMTSMAEPLVGTLTVAMLLAALALCHQGLSARVILLAALAAAVLGIFRLAYTSIPAVWLLADGIGGALGTVAGGITGQPLSIGATFGGVDFLVMMAALYTGWLIFTSPPRLSRAIYGAVAILAAQFVYLIALAYSEKLMALLPDVVSPTRSEKDRMGVWTLDNALRAALPWNLPVLAAILQAVVAAVMFRRAAWLPVADATVQGRQQTASQRAGPPAGPRKSRPALDALVRFGPMVLAAVIPVLTMLQWSTSADLKDKTILVFDQGPIDWHKPQYDRADPPSSRMFGMLPMFVESLGGKLVKSRELSDEELAEADVVVLLNPDKALPADRVEPLREFVAGGKSLLVAAAPRLQQGGDALGAVNGVLEWAGMSVDDAAATPAVEHWEQCCQALGHPVTAGRGDRRNHFALARGAPIRADWRARPMLVGRFAFAAGWLAWSSPHSGSDAPSSAEYVPGERLGDVLLAAERPYGDGRIVVLGDTAPLTDDGNVLAYEFTGRLLGYLAGDGASPQAMWRQLLGLLAAASLVGVLAWRPSAWQVMLSSAALWLSLAVCMAITTSAGRVLPDGRAQSPNNVAYIDASHLEAYSSNPRDECAGVSKIYDLGMGNFARTLMRNGYLPLLAPDLSPDRLERAGLLFSVAPGRSFSAADLEAVRLFVEKGGRLFCMAGAEDADVTNELLDYLQAKCRDFQPMSIPRSPVAPPQKTGPEPLPLGQFRQIFGDAKDSPRYVTFYAGWPVKCKKDFAYVAWSDGHGEDRPVVAAQPVEKGVVIVIGDTYFAANENVQLPSRKGEPSENDVFWRWFLSRVTEREPWNLPASSKLKEPIERDQPIEPDSEGMEP
jgi:hypothetical protein